MVRREGLYNKYQVFNRKSGQEAEGQYFVLKPESDYAARVALMAYAEAADNPQLTMDITVWLTGLPPLGSKSK
ncbi:hypothetical protein H70357_10555 [Paenibacillus sp. FSL H7-0357]|nr:hypothetical protein H70357_10555 [Paenibacillus sp. FSL H7-0357]